MHACNLSPGSTRARTEKTPTALAQHHLSCETPGSHAEHGAHSQVLRGTLLFVA